MDAHSLEDDDLVVVNGIGDRRVLIKHDDDSDVQGPIQPQVYKRRYYILLLFSLIIVMQGLIWNTWGPITKSAETVYGWSDATLGLLSNWGPITFIVITPFYTWIMDVKGLRWAAVSASLLVTIGAGLRCIPADTNTATWLIHAGHIFNGLAGPVAMGAPPLLSATWFPAHQRITATALSAASAGFGTALAFIVGPLLVPDLNAHPDGLQDPDIAAIKWDIMKLLYIEFGACGLLLILVLIYFPARPPAPPSISAATQRIDYKSGLSKLLRMPMFWLLGLPYGLSNGVYIGWCSVLEVNLKTRNISQNTAGWVGFYSLMVGSCVGMVVGRFADIFKRNVKIYLILLSSASVASFYIFTIAFDYYIPFSTELLYITNIACGTFIMGSVPLFYEFCCEITFPICEGLTTGFLTLLGNVSALAFLLILMIPNIGTWWMNWVCLGAIAACLPFLLFIKEQYRRLDIDTDSRI